MGSPPIVGRTLKLLLPENPAGPIVFFNDAIGFPYAWAITQDGLGLLLSFVTQVMAMAGYSAILGGECVDVTTPFCSGDSDIELVVNFEAGSLLHVLSLNRDLTTHKGS
jgi:hypothetical protein